MKDDKDKALRGAYIANIEMFLVRVILQWLQYGMTLPSELHLQLGADAKSDLPITTGKVWSLWIRLANLAGRVPPQSPRRAVIVAVVLGSDRHDRLERFIRHTDLQAQILRIQQGLKLSDKDTIAVNMTCVGDLPR